MKFSQFANLERFYNQRYNYWVDQLAAEGLSPYRYKAIEKYILYYDRQLERLHEKAEHLIYTPDTRKAANELAET